MRPLRRDPDKKMGAAHTRQLTRETGIKNAFCDQNPLRILFFFWWNFFRVAMWNGLKWEKGP